MFPDQPDNPTPPSTDTPPAQPEASSALPPPHLAAEQPPAAHGDAPDLDKLRERVIEACKSVYDPEIPVNIYELGLIYDVNIDAEHNVHVNMTLTSPACPSAQELPLEVQGRIAVLPGVKDVEVDIVFDPPWNPGKMSEAAKVQLGFDL